jgi:hypothetical protein
MTEGTGQAKGTFDTGSPLPPLSSTPFIMVSLAALFTAVITLVVLLGSAPAPALMALPDDWPPTVEDPSGVFAPATQPNDGDLSIEESGYSVIEDSIGDFLISWGAVVVNTSQEMAVGAVIAVRLKAADGSNIDMIGSEVHLNPIPPGGRVGIGDETYISDPDITEFQLAANNLSWWSPEAAVRIADFSVSEIETWWAGKGEPVMHWDDEDGISEQVSDGKLYLRVRVESQLRTVVASPGAAVLFRDEAGALIGGASLYLTHSLAAVPPGWSYQEFWVKYGPPADYDESKIEVHIHLRWY